MYVANIEFYDRKNNINCIS